MHVGNNFKSLRGLDYPVVQKLLKDVAEKKMTIQEMMAECKGIKVMRDIQAAFLRYVLKCDIGQYLSGHIHRSMLYIVNYVRE